MISYLIPKTEEALKSNRFQGFLLAGAEGLEPSTKVLETHVLPLHHAPKALTLYTGAGQDVNRENPCVVPYSITGYILLIIRVNIVILYSVNQSTPSRFWRSFLPPA